MGRWKFEKQKTRKTFVTRLLPEIVCLEQFYRNTCVSKLVWEFYKKIMSLLITL